MTEPLPPTQTPQESLGYQPVSPWAIAGFAASCLFALIVAVSAVAALLQGVPIYLPLWLFGFALFGIVLSLIGQQHVQNSEGNARPRQLARAGLWLSLFTGSGYFSYYYITGLALQHQANSFLLDMAEDSGFFPRLREGATNPAQINTAFLLTLPATARSGRPEDDLSMQSYHDLPSKDGNPGNLSQFKNSAFTRIFFGDLGKDAEITPLAVQDWRYEKRSYKIQRQYRIVTKDADMVFLMTVQSTEAENPGESRKWFVNLPESGPKSVDMTPPGKGIQILRKSAREMLERWAETLNQGQPFSTFKDRDQTAWSRLGLLVGNRDQARNAVTKAFTGREKGRLRRFGILSRQDDISKWEPVDGRIRIYHYFRFSLVTDAGELGFPIVYGYVALDSRQPVDPAKIDRRAPMPDWDVTRIVVTNIIPTPAPKGS